MTTKALLRLPMLKKSPFIILLGAGILALSSCSLTIFDIIGGGGLPGGGGIDVSLLPDGNYGVAGNSISLEDYSLNIGTRAMPSAGDVEILVLPIEIEGYELPETEKNVVLQELDTVFNGTPEETGWESLSSFYEESSYGKLNLHATVAPWYECGMTVGEIERLNLSSNSAEGVSYLMREAVSSYRATSASSLSEFDSNDDGYLDAVWMVYSAPYDASGSASSVQWAFTFWDYEARPSLSSPVGCAYSWASYEFLYEGYGHRAVDAHTFVHETGHLLGLEDYYDTMGNTSPVGYVDMMDANIIDHCAYSKFALGWIDPYIVTKEGSITIGNLEETGNAIIIPTKGGYGGSSFDEYLILELYAPVGLNAQDSKEPYGGNKFQGFRSAGIRLYHVDARLVRMVYQNGEYYLTNDYVDDIPASGAAMWASNTVSERDEAKSAFRQISLIAPARVGITFETSNTCATLAQTSSGQVISGVSDCLFKSGDSLSYDDAKTVEQFPNGRAGEREISNDGTGFAFEFSVLSVAADGSEATINFTRA